MQVRHLAACWLLLLGACSAPDPPHPPHQPGPANSARPLSPKPVEVPVVKSPRVTTASLSCPATMAKVPGGTFWMGSERGKFADDEAPRFQTKLRSFCLDFTEVTVNAYQTCVERGVCRAAHDDQFHCTTRSRKPQKNLLDHPINCVDHGQAASFCESVGARLPTEVEWEYAARGGEKHLTYPWGEGSPDGRACWKHLGTCAVKSFPAFELGLYDMSGNVWEWTADWYGAYPWPALNGFSRVYRGGSFSRRFEKWMHTRLRNREVPTRWGSHLGFRCARSLNAEACPFGPAEDGLACRAGVLQVQCAEGRVWNGLRCARPGEGGCRPGFQAKPGYGCVLPEPPGPPESQAAEVDTSQVSRRRNPAFDSDCRTYKKGLPAAYQYTGGSHGARNLASARAGCKNRDVGNGWNSTCCPGP